MQNPLALSIFTPRKSASHWVGLDRRR